MPLRYISSVNKKGQAIKPVLFVMYRQDLLSLVSLSFFSVLSPVIDTGNIGDNDSQSEHY